MLTASGEWPAAFLLRRRRFLGLLPALLLSVVLMPYRSCLASAADSRGRHPDLGTISSSLCRMRRTCLLLSPGYSCFVGGMLQLCLLLHVAASPAAGDHLQVISRLVCSIQHCCTLPLNSSVCCLLLQRPALAMLRCSASGQQQASSSPGEGGAVDLADSLAATASGAVAKSILRRTAFWLGSTQLRGLLACLCCLLMPAVTTMVSRPPGGCSKARGL